MWDVNVSAKDMATGKEQKITITSSTKLSDDEINAKIKEAEQFAEQDKKQKEAVETKNQSEGMIFEIDKQLKELGDKVTDSEKAAVEAAKDELQKAVDNGGRNDIIIGTVEAAPGIDETIKTVRERGFTSAVIMPLMIVAGEHALTDMSGPQPDSWKSRLEAEGLKVSCLNQGMGSIPDIREMITDHCSEAMNG